MLHISLAAEELWKIGFLPITNSLVMTYIVMAILFLIVFRVHQGLKNVPSTFQNILELVIGGFYDFFTSLAGPHIQRVFPLVMTIFLFVVLSNWLGLLPGVGTIGMYKAHEKESVVVEEQVPVATEEDAVVAKVVDDHGAEVLEPKAVSADHEESSAAAAGTTEAHGTDAPAFVPLFRPPTADLNLTLALGIIAFFAIQYFGFSIGGLSYGKKFINVTNPIFFFVGILEIISDISKIISFAFRLFGNIFAGEVLLAVMAFLLPFFLPIPFLGMEIFVGFVQALVFAMLVGVFINIATAHGHETHAEHA